MSLELGQPADGDQATSAEEPEEEGTATRDGSDTPGAYADSGASPAPRFSALWGTPDTSGTTESSTTADPPDDPDDSEPSTSGPPTIPGTVVDSDTPDTSDTPEITDAPEASSAQDDASAEEASPVAQDPGEPAASDASGAAEPVDDADTPVSPDASVPDDAADEPVVHSPAVPSAQVTDAAPEADADTAADADLASAEEPAAGAADDDEASGATQAVSVPAQASPEDMTGGPSAVGTTASVVPAGEEATPVAEPSADGGRPSVAARLEAAAGDLDGPLIGDVEGLRYSWQQIQIGFVDDPREAVVDAAVLVEHAAQALIGALQQRQRLLRSLWDRNTSLDGLGASPTSSPGEAPTSGRPQPTSDTPDTEDLRLLIQRYRTMFNEICRP